MNELTEAQLTVGALADFAIVNKTLQGAMQFTEPLFFFVFIISQLLAPFIISIILLWILEKSKIFDLKTNSILTLITIVTPYLI